MCGRFALITPSESLRQMLDFTNQPHFQPRYNIAPGQSIAIICQAASVRACVNAYWGLIPQWLKLPLKQSLKQKTKYSPQHNAKGETVHEKPFFKNAYRYRRCLIPADAFYEWRKSDKQPFCVRRCDQEPFIMAGLWEESVDAKGQKITSCAIITTQANAALSPIHARMPVILESQNWDRWLTTAPQKAERLSELLIPAAEEDFAAYPISKAVNQLANDNYKLWQQASPQLKEAQLTEAQSTETQLTAEFVEDETGDK
ncbi:MAG: SOS response-associated peptidase [Alphaproteobacteria bacterium]|nr:SOS response-associated peptidase [Alphaproteobacteria bacterium]